ncbi:protein FosB isoform X2 [Equus quagga]|uniref:FosB proto-onco, AP-1 transcription factor subunit n=2 Tax=Equus TaxID=9789 RepID=A0A5F5PYJ9_HORSE|nr:protein fosB isoform X2 [Equus asinus]XP_046539722.1 protein FosB isoform X2 [Equus quagga]
MFQAFPGDYDSGSRCSSSPSAESQYLSSVDSFGSPPTAAASQECAGLGEMPGSFVPTVTAITTSQDLQWLVQPTLISSMAQSQGQPLASQPPAVDPYDMPGTSYSTPGMSGYSSGGAGGSGGPSTSGTTSGPGPSRPARARPRRPREETETDQLEEEKAELESEIAELQKEKERLEFVLVAHKPGCKIPYEEGPGPGPLPEVRGLPGSASTKEDGFSWLLPPPPPPPLPFQTSQDAPPNLTASLFTHSEVQVLGDPFPVVNPSYTSSFVLTCPEVSAFAGAQRTSGSDQPCDPLNSPSLLAL